MTVLVNEIPDYLDVFYVQKDRCNNERVLLKEGHAWEQHASMIAKALSDNAHGYDNAYFMAYEAAKVLHNLYLERQYNKLQSWAQYRKWALTHLKPFTNPDNTSEDAWMYETFSVYKNELALWFSSTIDNYYWVDQVLQTPKYKQRVSSGNDLMMAASLLALQDAVVATVDYMIGWRE